MDAQTLMQWMGCALGVAGSYVLARNDRFSGWGFVAYLGSNAAWFMYGWVNNVPALAIQHTFFAVISSFGVWRWLVLPRMTAGAGGRAGPSSSTVRPFGNRR